MITMLHYDALHNPVSAPVITAKKNPQVNEAQHGAYLEKYNYSKYTEDDIAKVSEPPPPDFWFPSTYKKHI